MLLGGLIASNTMELIKSIPMLSLIDQHQYEDI